MQDILAHLKYVAALPVESQKVQICGKLRTRWTFSRPVMVSVGISKFGLWDLIFVHPGVKINCSYYLVITVSWVVHFVGHSVVL